jgi:hypothetical protein
MTNTTTAGIDLDLKALAAIRNRLELTYSLCLSLAPKQAVGELLDVALNMPEWETVHSALARRSTSGSEERGMVPSQMKEPSSGSDGTAAADAEGLRAFWVLERFTDGRSAGYWDGSHSQSFTNDIEKACQFCRKEDVFWATRGWRGSDTKLTEHIMLPNAATAPPTALTVPAAAFDAVMLNARAVVKRWDSPLWRQEVGTAEFVNQLRKALDAAEQAWLQPLPAPAAGACQPLADERAVDWPHAPGRPGAHDAPPNPSLAILHDGVWYVPYVAQQAGAHADAVAIRWPGSRGGKWEFADVNDTVAAEVLQNPKLENLYAAPAPSAEADRDAKRYRVLREHVSPAAVRIAMRSIPPQGQSCEERIDMLCDQLLGSAKVKPQGPICMGMDCTCGGDCPAQSKTSEAS